MDLRVFHFPPAADGYKISMPCVTLETYLALVGQPYVSVTKNAARASRTKTIPGVHVDGRVIGDTENIIRYLESRLDEPLDAHLSREQAILNKVFWRLINTSIHQLVVADRWTHPETEGRFLPYVVESAGIAWLGPLGRAVMKRVLRRVIPRQVGLIRYLSHEDRLVFARENFAALEFYLAEQRYLFGERPSTSDCYLYSYLGALLVAPFDTPLSRVVTGELPKLVAYFERTSAELARRAA
jgi:glutathione S-transferase